MKKSPIVSPGTDGRTSEATSERAILKTIYQLADDGGTIQAGDMVGLFPGEPKKHATASMKTAAGWLGIEL